MCYVILRFNFPFASFLSNDFYITFQLVKERFETRKQLDLVKK